MKRLLILALAATATACRCGPPTNTGNPPDYVPDPKAVQFEACPTKDEAGKAVADVFPDEKKVKVKNVGSSPGGFKATFSGDDAAAFTLDAMRTPMGIEPSVEVEVPIRFAPTKKGDSRAQLVISAEYDGAKDVTIDLIGQGSTLAAQPTLDVALQNKDLPAMTDACLEQPDGNLRCTHDYPDTVEREASTLAITLKNLGCPALKVTGMEILPIDPSEPLSFFLDEPAVAPSETTPLLLATTGGTPVSTLKIRFAPQPSANTQRSAYLRLKTNDPRLKDSDGNVGGLDIILQGVATKASVFTTPTSCNYSDPADDCGGSKANNEATFLVRNDGDTAITVDSVTFKGNSSETMSQGGRFTIVTNPKGKSIAPGSAGEPLVIRHSEMPIFVQEQVVVSASIGAMGPGSGGRATVALSGGKRPCLETDPPMMNGQVRIDFGAPEAELSAKALTIKNGSGAACGDLIINKVSIDQSPFFSLLEPLVAPGTKVTPGGSAEATIQFKRPVSGGTQIGVLRIDANDLSAAAPAYFVVQLYSAAPLDERPVAVLQACIPPDTACAMPKTTSFSVRLATLGTAKELIVSGKPSYDPPAASGGITNYQFRLVQKPSNAAGAMLEKDGQKQSSSEVKLTLDPAATGQYRVTLGVFDSRDQQSGGSADMIINVQP